MLVDKILDLNIETSDFVSDKDYNRFISICKRMIRQSYEYQNWTKYIKFTQGYDYCQFTRENAFELTIDLHHHPLSMENIVKTIIDFQLKNNGFVTSYSITKEVLENHYDDNIGYVMMISSLHEKYHNGFLKIPIEFAHGNWQNFINKYPIDPDIIKIVENFKSYKLFDLMKDNNNNTYNWTNENYILTDGEENR